MMAVVVMVTLVEPPAPMMMTVMAAVVSLLDGRASFARGRQLAKHVAGGGSGLSATDCDDAGESTRDGS